MSYKNKAGYPEKEIFEDILGAVTLCVILIVFVAIYIGLAL